jgi:exonuclease III
MRYRTWNVGSLCRAGALKTVANELATCNLDLVTVKEVRWDKSGSQPADDYTFHYGNGDANHYLGTGLFVHKGTHGKDEKCMQYFGWKT